METFANMMLNRNKTIRENEAEVQKLKLDGSEADIEIDEQGLDENAEGCDAEEQAEAPKTGTAERDEGFKVETEGTAEAENKVTEDAVVVHSMGDSEEIKELEEVNPRIEEVSTSRKSEFSIVVIFVFLVNFF